MLKCIAAIARNGVIGNGKSIPWRSSVDMRWFRRATFTHNLLMGRKTYQSLGGPLDGRTTYVITSNPQILDQDESEFLRFVSPNNLLPFLLDWEARQEIMFVCGGAFVYQETLSFCDELLITHVDIEPDLINPVRFPLALLRELTSYLGWSTKHGTDEWSLHAHESYSASPGKLTRVINEPDVTIAHYVKTSCDRRKDRMPVQSYFPFLPVK